MPGELGIDLHTVRDAVARRDRAVVDPRTGSRLPGGFRGVFAALAEYGYQTVELAGYDQGANGPIAPAEIRALLEARGLRAVATKVDLGRLVDPDVRRRELDRALAVGAEWVGTPGGPAGGGVAAWQAAAERLNAIGAAAGERGLGFFHRDGACRVRLSLIRRPTWRASGATRRSSTGRNPRAVSLELDVFSAYVARHRYPPDADGSQRSRPLAPHGVAERAGALGQAGRTGQGLLDRPDSGAGAPRRRGVT